MPHDLTVKDYSKARQTRNYVKLGQYFAFVEDQKALTRRDRIKGRLERLLVKKSEKVFPLLKSPVELNGVTIEPKRPLIDQLGCIVSDRDVYRSEQDTINLFIAFPSPPDDLRLILEYNGQIFSDQQIHLKDSVAIEQFFDLLPGQYKARLKTAGNIVGAPAFFTVAEYTLAPLSARLIYYEFQHDTNKLKFQLAVESYQQPFKGKIFAELAAQGQILDSAKLEPADLGKYQGVFEIQGKGPFRIRLTDETDSERVAEVAIPGSRKAEREFSVVSELGREVQFSLMPSPDAIPVRGGYLTQGDFLATPLMVDEVITDRQVIKANLPIESLVLVTLNLLTGDYDVQKIGDMAPETFITVEKKGSLTMVFAGCFVHGHPFEGYTTFIEPSRLNLSVHAPETVRPGQDIEISLSCQEAKTPVPVLLCIKDQRLTSTDSPEKALGAAMKRSVDTAIQNMEDSAILPMHLLIEENEKILFAAGSQLEQHETFLDFDIEDIDTDEDLSFDLFLDKRELNEPKKRFRKTTPMPEEQKTPPQKTPPPKPFSEFEFPQILFYAIVPVKKSENIKLALPQSLGTFTVEAFALYQQDWIQASTVFMIDQPVRADLEMPPAVYFKDRVWAKFRGAAGSGKVRMTLTCDDKIVYVNGEPIENKELDAPAELIFEVKPGKYTARVEDVETNETHLLEKQVNEPGRFKSYAKTLRLLQSGEQFCLSQENALNLRVLPSIDQPFKKLLTATAGYAHLCCEQTAAKILSAVFMYLNAENTKVQRKAETIILGGIAREKRMFRPKKGFAMYPDNKNADDYWGRLAVRYLWHLTALKNLPDLSANLQKNIQSGLEMADKAGRAYGMSRVPQKINSFEDVYVWAGSGANKNTAKKFIDDAIDFSNDIPCLKNIKHKVADRAAMAYAAAALIIFGDFSLGISLANQVTQDLNAQGALYSTTDSVAAIALMAEMQRAGIVNSHAQIQINGQDLKLKNDPPDKIESVNVIKGVAVLELTCIIEENWADIKNNFPVEIKFYCQKNQTKRFFKAGDNAHLSISLPKGYETGDMVHVCLPPALSWIEGGAKIKQFTMDFEGRDQIKIPVVVTSEIQDRQHFSVCVRNMFKQERAASPGLLTIEPRFPTDKYFGKWQNPENESEYILFHPDLPSKFHFKDICGIMDCRVEKYKEFERIEFSWQDSESLKKPAIAGRGWAQIDTDELFGKIYVHNKDEFDFFAKFVKK